MAIPDSAAPAASARTAVRAGERGPASVATKSAASLALEAISHRRSCAASPAAASVPSPSAASRAPSERTTTRAPAVRASSPTHGAATRSGAANSMAPISTRPAASTRAAVCTCPAIGGRRYHHAGPSGRSEPGFRAGRLEQLDWIAGRVLDEDLHATHAGDDLVAKSGAVLAQSCHRGLEVLDLELEAIPSSGLRYGPVRHRLAASGLPARRAQDQPQISVREHREAGRRVHVLVEAELAAVEVDRGVDVVDDVADADLGHRVLLV